MISSPIIIVYGPTGVGKTELVDLLATQLPISVVNMDMGQMYKPLIIGTAKPDWKQHPVPHYLFDWFDEPVSCTAARYRSAVIDLLPEIIKSGSIPVLVGGTGFYTRSLLFPIVEETPAIDMHIDRSQYSWELLHQIDPKRASEIHPHDTYRITRALDIWFSTGQMPSQYAPSYKPIAPYLLIGLTRDITELHMRIQERTIQMLTHGWIDEVRSLKDTPWRTFWNQKGFIGYEDIAIALEQHSENPVNPQLIETIYIKTRQYAKRQMTLWRTLNRMLSDVPKDPKYYVKTVHLTGNGNIDITIQNIIEICYKLR